MDLKKVFYIIVCVALIAITTTSIAKPVYDKISAQKSKIESVDFNPSGSVVAP